MISHQSTPSVPHLNIALIVDHTVYADLLYYTSRLARVYFKQTGIMYFPDLRQCAFSHCAFEIREINVKFFENPELMLLVFSNRQNVTFCKIFNFFR